MTPDDRTLRAAVIGVGHLGRHHARLMKEVPGVELVGVVDRDLDRARAVAGDLDVPAADEPGMLGPLDAASVAVPTSAHGAVACPLLERGVHLLVEKPMAATLEEARRMADLARARRLVLQVGHIERFNPALRVVRELGIRPRFIEAHRLAPFNFRTLDSSVVMDLMIHDLDLVLDLAAAPLTRVDAVGGAVLGRQVDIANARLTFEDGCVANVTASRVSFEPLRRTRYFTEECFVSLDFAARKAFVVKKADGFEMKSLGPESMAAHPPRDSFREFVAQGLMDLTELDMDDGGNPLLMELTAFAETVRGGPLPGTEDLLPPASSASAQDALAAMEVADRVTRRIEEHRWT